MTGASPASPALGKREIKGIQILRGYAAVLVAIEHVTGQVSRYSDHPLNTGFITGGMGVDIFFTISGFIMIYTSYDHFGSAARAREFLTRRIIRVVPLYWLFTLLIAASLIAAPGAFKSASFDWGNLFASLFFVPYRQASGIMKPLLSVGWTLNYEALFYVLFAASLFFRRKWGLVFLFGSIAALIAAGKIFTFHSTVLDYWTWSITAEFLFGVTVGLLYIHFGSRPIPVPVWIGLFLLCSVLAMGSGAWDAGDDSVRVFRALKWGIPSALLLVLGTIVVPNRRFPRLLSFGEKIGDSSYALYLSHRFVFGAATALWAAVIGFRTLPYWMPITFLVVVAIGAGYGVHLIVEKPTIRFLNGLVRRRALKSSAVRDDVETVPRND